jgi:hypothetical protein
MSGCVWSPFLTVTQFDFFPFLQILQCLSIQGLTSSGGSGVGADGGSNSSGISRAIVKDRSVKVTII